jgi:hypothetical protein
MRWWHWSECSRSGSRWRAPATVVDAGHKGRGYTRRPRGPGLHASATRAGATRAGHKGRGYVLYLAYLDFLRAGEMPYDRHFRQGLPFLLNC